MCGFVCVFVWRQEAFSVCVRVGVEVCSEGDTVAGVHKYRGPMWFQPLYWSGVIGSMTDSVGTGMLYVRLTAFSAFSLSLSLSFAPRIQSLYIAGFHLPPLHPRVFPEWRWKLILLSAAHPRQDCALRTGSRARSPRPDPPQNEEKQVFVSACKQDLKFHPLSDAEGPWLWPRVVSGINQNGSCKCRTVFIEKNAVPERCWSPDRPNCL